MQQSFATPLREPINICCRKITQLAQNALRGPAVLSGALLHALVCEALAEDAKLMLPKPAYLEKDWEVVSPSAAGCDEELLHKGIDERMRLAEDKPFHLVVTRYGRIFLDRHVNTEPLTRSPSASIAKSLYASMVPIAIAEGVIAAPGARVLDVYPHLREAQGNFGPHPPKKRFFTEPDADVTFLQVVTQTDGLLDAHRTPGISWVYRTDGSVAMIHALAFAYGAYDPQQPDAGEGVGGLIGRKLRDPIGAGWDWSYREWNLHPEAKWNVFGRFVEFHMNAYDMARFGLLYLAMGNWDGRQILDPAWALAAGRVAEEVKLVSPRHDWKYGYGFWSNEFGALWPDLPRDSFMAAGFGGRKIWICRSQRMVIALNPDISSGRFIDDVHDAETIRAVLAALAKQD